MTSDSIYWFIVIFMAIMFFTIFKFDSPTTSNIFKCDEIDCMYETYNKHSFVRHIKSHHKACISINIFTKNNEIKDLPGLSKCVVLKDIVPEDSASGDIVSRDIVSRDIVTRDIVTESVAPETLKKGVAPKGIVPKEIVPKGIVPKGIVPKVAPKVAPKE